MVCKGCGERLFGPRRDYCKSCKADLAVSWPSEMTASMEAPMAADQKTPTREERIAALPLLPERTRYVYNRTDSPWEGMFDGRVYELQAHEIKPMDCAVAEHLRATSIITGTLRRMSGGGGTLTAERAIALGPGWAITGSAKIQDDFVLQYEVAESEPEFLVPTDTKPGAELFDRTSIPNYVDRPNVKEPGKPMHTEIVRV